MSLVLLICLGATGVAAAEPWERVDLHAVGIDSAEVMDLYVDPAGDMWVGTWTGAASYRAGRWTLHNPSKPRVVHGFTGGGSQPLWAFLNDGVARYEGGSWLVYDAGGISTGEGFECFHTYDSDLVSADGNGVLHGVPLIPGSGVDLLLDHSGTLWITTNALPILRFAGGVLTCWNDFDYAAGISSLAETDDGTVWALLADGQVYTYAAEVWTPVEVPASPVEIETREGRLYLRSFESVWCLEGGTWQKIYDAQRDGFSFLGGFTVTGPGEMWVARWQRSEGIKRGYTVSKYVDLEEVQRLEFPHDKSFTLDVQVQLAESPDGALWLGDRSGLYRHEDRPTADTPATWGQVKASSRAP